MEDQGPIPELRTRTELNHPYSLCGRNCYLIGFQNGLFPDIGWHKTKEMGGVWTHPIKIADGYWISLDSVGWPPPESYNPIRREWFKECEEFVLGDGGAWTELRYKKFGTTVARREFIPHDEPALGVELHLTSQDNAPRQVRLSVLVRFDIVTAWQSGWPDPMHLETEAIDGGVTVHGVSGYDIPYEYGYWAAAMRCDPKPDKLAIGESLWGPERTTGNGVSCLMTFIVDMNPDAKVRFVMAGDIKGGEAALGAVDRVLGNYDALFNDKVNRYRQIAGELTNVETPEPLLNDAMLWSKMNLEWLTQTSQCVGTCTVAGHQDFTSYFGGDTFVSIRGMLASGLHETARDSLRTIGAIALKNGGRAPHEFSTTGNVHDPGNVGETGYFVQSVWDAYIWTGDEEFFNELYPICRKGMMEYIPSEPSMDGVLLAEFEDRPGGERDKCIPDALAMGYRAFANLAERAGDTEAAAKARAQAEEFQRQIEELFWVEEPAGYASSLDSDNKPVVDLEEEFWGRPFEGIAYTFVGRKDRMVKVLERFDGPQFATEFGVPLSSGRNCNMPVTTGKAAIAEFNYGRQEQGLEFVRMMSRAIGHAMPGAAPEGMDPYGDLSKFRHFRSAHWNYLQLWSAAFIPEGLLWGILRLEPDAPRNAATMTPSLPEGWPGVKFRNITIGNSRIDVTLDEKGAKVTHVDGPKLKIDIRKCQQ